MQGFIIMIELLEVFERFGMNIHPAWFVVALLVSFLVALGKSWLTQKTKIKDLEEELNKTKRIANQYQKQYDECNRKFDLISHNLVGFSEIVGDLRTFLMIAIADKSSSETQVIRNILQHIDNKMKSYR